MSLRIPIVTLLRQFDTVRLIPSRFSEKEDSVLMSLAENKTHLQDLFDLDNATNTRLLAEQGRLPGIGVEELVFGVPNFRMINAAFTYARPEGSRFNHADRGAWYCSFEFETALAEVIFHKTVEYAEINWFEDSVSYQALLADFSAPFHDLRRFGFKKYLDPQSYIASQELGSKLLQEGSMGIIYPSVRSAEGTNLVCFRPALVGNVRRTDSYELTWTGSDTPKIKRLNKSTNG